jgi:prepilin-type N-terminal cleavage/methylation domain-containing protein
VRAEARDRDGRGFSILELLVAMAIFLAICGAMFELLRMSQEKYSGETQLSAAYQDSRLAMDQIVRDFNVAGYPPADMFSVLPSSVSQYAITPVAWSPGYIAVPPSPCSVGTGGVGTPCMTPGDYDLIIETRIPTDATDTTVKWVWYHLDQPSFTLYREVVVKTANDPLSEVLAGNSQTPFLKNVMNRPGSQMSQITANYPAMFPGGQPQPIFQYTCDTPGGPLPCSLAGSSNSPKSIRDVDVTLIVMTPQQDLQTQGLKLVELFGRGHRSNPSN